MGSKYYRYFGFKDGSGCPSGIIIKCYTDKQFEYMSKIYKLVEINSEIKEL